MESDNFAMRSSTGRHWQRVNTAAIISHSILAASSVSRPEFSGNPGAMEAYWKEWNNLEAKTFWDLDSLCEWDTVASDARANDTEVHFGFLFGIVVEKGSEYPEGDPRRCWKYRVVFRGNDVKDQDWNVALFQEMASTPTTLEASRYSDFYSLMDPDHSSEGRDVQQTYLQAELSGSPTYICLPKELWTA